MNSTNNGAGAACQKPRRVSCPQARNKFYRFLRRRVRRTKTPLAQRAPNVHRTWTPKRTPFVGKGFAFFDKLWAAE